MEFMIGGAAAIGAGIFTNPLEVLKIRMQLQGELEARGQHVTHYKNVLHAAYVVAKNDGILALQKGLAPALGVQFVLNGTRLGTYQIADGCGYVRNQKGEVIFHRSVIAASLGGIIGQYVSSPLFLVKTHLQSEASAAIAVGHQHGHRGTWAALKNIYKSHGVKGLFRGAVASLPRVTLGSATQLTTFEYAKQYLDGYEFIKNKPILKSFLGSMLGGIAVTFAMSPLDLIMVRLYNQPTDENGKGKLYKNYFDCVVKIYKSEGLIGFYKGVGPMYLRIGPHTVLCLMFWDELKSLYDRYAAQQTTS